jgi:diguanylate cyclase (GGDEF)-like protein
VREASSSPDWARATVSASVGIACFPQHARDADELIKRADIAMYDAKAAGRNCWRMSATEEEPQAVPETRF